MWTKILEERQLEVDKQIAEIEENTKKHREKCSGKNMMNAVDISNKVNQQYEQQLDDDWHRLNHLKPDQQSK
jgi:hypothetical protein